MNLKSHIGFYPELKKDLPPGEWMDEHDQELWIDEATGLTCMLARNPDVGTLCGYVAIPQGHHLYGKDYNSLDISAHGGITYASKERPGLYQPEYLKVVNELPLWWIGFDCCHFMDLWPARIKWQQSHKDYIERIRPGFPDWLNEVKLESYPSDFCKETYKDINYVKAQCADIARQVQEAGKFLPRTLKQLTGAIKELEDDIQGQ